ncbi:MAG: hypothetical protein QOE45_2238 [Frankiaceae bacterium]|jgi:hypothetical protein|nr:hypothetical protein [Frankiaceae bacterium]
MVADTLAYVAPRQRLHEHFAQRARAGDPPRWLAQAWARAVLVRPTADDAGVLALLEAEWARFRAGHPGEPAVAFRPPPALADDRVVPGPPPYELLPPLAHGRYGLDMPMHEDRF